MTRQQKNKRTGARELAVPEQELTGTELKQVEGGISNLNLSKSNVLQTETNYLFKPGDKMTPK